MARSPPMGIFGRASRVIASNFNALLDGAEDPKKSVELSLQELKGALRDARREVVSAVAAEKQLKIRIAELDKELKSWERRAELALKHGDEPLARQALLQKRRVVDEATHAEQLRVEARGLALQMKEDLEDMGRRLEKFQAQKSELIRNKQKALSSGAGDKASQADAFGEFRQVEQELDGVDAAIDAHQEVEELLRPTSGPTGMTREEVDAQFRALELGDNSAVLATGDAAIDAELNALKTRVRVKPK